MSGIYVIINKINSKVYVGQAININRRWKQHKYKLKKNKHTNKHLQNAWNKYGEENFEFMILEICNEYFLDKKEKYYIRQLYSILKNFGYNKIYGGKSNRHTEETKKKISEGNKGKIVTEESRIRMSKSHKGEIPWNKNIPRDEETKRKISNTLKGRTLTEETKIKISNTLKGRIFTDETKNKISNALKNKPKSEEHKIKMSNAFKGKKITEERRRKRAKIVKQLDLSGKLIKIWYGIKLIERELGFNNTAISRCCRNKQKTAYGFRWEFIDIIN